MKTKTRLNKLTSYLVTMMIMLSVLSGLTMTTSAEVASGTCGDDATWVYDIETKTLIISGSGKMTNYTVGNRPWEDYIDDIENAVIEKGITEIGEYFLKNCTSLKNISISTTVTDIRTQAFFGCSSITEVVIPDGVKTIFNSAFANCTSLIGVTIGNDISGIWSTAFYGCSNLEYAIMGISINSVVKDAFWNCPKLTDVYINGTNAEWEAKSSQPAFATSYNGTTNPPTLHFSDDTTMVTFNAVEGSCFIPTSLVDENGKLSFLPTATKDRCTFVGWYDAEGNQVTADTVFAESTTLYAHWSTASEHKTEYTGYCGTENTVYFYMSDYLPADAVITSMSASLPLKFGKQYNTTYTSDINQSYAILYTKIIDNAASEVYTITVNTSNYDTITINATINLIDFEITNYDSSNKTAVLTVPVAGTYTVIFADYEGSKLVNVDVVEVTVTEIGTVTPQMDSDKTFTLSVGDKIMLWSNPENLVPKCDAYTVE